MKHTVKVPMVSISVSIPTDVLAKTQEFGKGNSRSEKIVHFTKLGLKTEGLIQ